MIPYYNIEWHDPRGIMSVDIEIDGNHKVLTAMGVCCSSLWKDSLIIPVKPQELATGEAPAFAIGNSALEDAFITNLHTNTVSQKELTGLLLQMLPPITECARKLATSIPLPITTNQVDYYYFSRNPRKVYLTDGYEFVYRNGYVSDFQAPDALFVGPLKSRVQRYWGRWNMSKDEAIELARATLTKLGYWKAPYFYDERPDDVSKALEIGGHTIPRFLITWTHTVSEGKDAKQSDMALAASIEIDAETRSVKSFHVIARSLPAMDRDIKDQSQTK